MSDIPNPRQTLPGVSSLFVERWSPRAFKKTPIDQAMLTRCIEAARWSPSCYNEQPWRFYTSNDDSFNDYLELLVDANQIWAKNASVIGFVVGKKHFTHNDQANPTFALDCGAAWLAMTLQARTEGWYTHGMAGIKHNAISDYFKLDPMQDQVMMGFVVGQLGDPAQLNDALREKEQPSLRKPLEEIWLQC